MKTNYLSVFLILAFAAMGINAAAQDKKAYIVKDGATLYEGYVADIDSIIFTVKPFSGDGTAENPFQVASAADLQKVGSGTEGWTLSAHYIQTADIDLVSSWQPIGASGNFIGSYDGGGFTISNLKISGGDTKGLFRIIGTGGVVKKVALTGVNISGNYNVGGVAAWNYGTIEQCYVTGSISAAGGYIGGIVGALTSGGKVQNCYTTCSVTGAERVGGIVGTSSSMLPVQNCYATGAITGSYNVGGVVGQPYASESNCVALNKQVKAIDNTIRIGRVVGENRTLINNYARNDMILTANGVDVTVTPDASNMHGADVIATEYSSSDWWTDTGTWSSGGAWDFTNVWEWNSSSSLPVLQGFSEEQNPKVTP